MKLEDLNEQQREKISEFGVNTWYVLDLLAQYKEDAKSVPEKWQNFFKDINIDSLTYSVSNGHTNGAAQSAPVIMQTAGKVSMPPPAANEQAMPLRGAGAKIVDNMTGSLTIPTATTFRTIPVKVLEENRMIINQYFKKLNLGKISFTHIIGWALVKAIGSAQVMNNSFTIVDGQPTLVVKKDINLGLAIDIEKKDGSRSLLVPNIKKANEMNFQRFLDAYNDIVNRSKTGKIEVADFMGTTISLTNPGGLGTVASNPRLMIGQGAIIATGAIEYPAEFQAVTQDIITSLGISKIMNMTSTYDHRIIQGAESGLFLKKVHELLIGEENFYESIFADLKIPSRPVVWKADNNAEDFVGINNIAEIEKHGKALQLINMFRVRGHLLANIDPLFPKVQYHPELDSANYGFTVWDYDREFITDGLAGKRSAKLREILSILHETYCGSIGVEYRHIQDPDEKKWLQDQMESTRNKGNFSHEEKMLMLNKLIQAENFEKFIHTKYVGHKRFSLEGMETIIPVLDYLNDEAAKEDVQEIVYGMAHRGRLNVLANIVNKSLFSIFSEFEDIVDTRSSQGSGDVKYHLGATGEYETLSGKKINVSIASNPSHLEFVNPVVEGIVRAKQTRTDDKDRNKTLAVVLHGDAAFAGEGVVAETLNLSQLKGYTTGGTIHIIVNNQIGFTTDPKEGRSTTYATDVAKMVQAPIFHVNGEDPEACLWVTKLAYEYRQKFKKDVVVDVLGYRKYGHNEADEPSFTQPLMYKVIKGRASIKEIYEKQLLKAGVVTEADIVKLENIYNNRLTEAFEKAKGSHQEFKHDDPMAMTKDEISTIHFDKNTAIDELSFNKIVTAITTFPEGFNVHPKLKKFNEMRSELLTNSKAPIDWAFAEALAFGSLIEEGISVRLSGQDVSRGTFSHRHVVFADAENGHEFTPLNQLATKNARLEPVDSSLSEAAVLGFEYGYATADPMALVIWEAQFGDFANAGQVIIDNFVTSSSSKWNLHNNLVMLLPHGQEGQGPEHSSARLERFLTLCADNNMYVCNCTTASQYFHLLRRQAKLTGKERRPLAVMSPKSLLRASQAASGKKEFIEGKFWEVIEDINLQGNANDVKTIILTSGKIYYDADKYRMENGIKDTAIVRLEQYYPFPEDLLIFVLSQYKNAKSLVWLQEEPENMGAYNFLALELLRLTQNKMKFYAVCREPSASPAPGSNKVFQMTQKQIIAEAFSVSQ
ncbi:MAG: multifunctional oxoglutarate decarboxylase/oxoglutarate dehydrogenase thiamine pyrophosphate-binding subunit/dihydrolipoyllysine-residue succinyltransferase subunit [Bacteroidetes bacterium]|nr:multifunctional oxoglutarate decarboxylase/oxoglutarate dehydrogenase thiamine pyrophosphate-binding subunit/dihydrolipoyllysine-residue succinyltransferase subunit [Bacteroidota bacterium]